MRAAVICAISIAATLFGGCASVEFPSDQFKSSLTSFVADSSSRHLDQAISEQAQKQMTDGQLVGWGRYVINRAGSTVEVGNSRELTAVEINFARTHQVHFIPIVAPDQRQLKLGETEGSALAHEAADVVSHVAAGFTQSPSDAQVIIFLDVEGDAHPASAAYLTGWCKGLADKSSAHLTFLAGIYTGGAALTARKAIIEASASCPIAGVWFANYVGDGAPPAVWKNFNLDTKRKLPAIPESIPIYLWQYYGGNPLDFSVVNPYLSAEFLAKTLTF